MGALCMGLLELVALPRVGVGPVVSDEVGEKIHG